MAEVERAKQVLEEERKTVLRELRKAAADQKRDAERYAARQQKSQERIVELLARGRSAGVPLTELAAALGVSRQWATRLSSEQTRAAIIRRLSDGKKENGHA